MPLSFREARAVLLGGREGPGYVLGIDQATSSGWAVVDLQTLRCVRSGQVRGHLEQEHALAELAEVPGLCWPSVLVVLEDHRHIPARDGIPTGSLLTLGEARGRWLALLSQRGQPEGARILAEPSVWRRMLGTTARLPRKAWKAQAVAWAKAHTGRDVRNDDEAEAVVIALWGATEGLVKWANERREVTPAKRPRQPRKRSA